MYKTFFKELAAKENGTFAYSDEDISVGMGVRNPSVVFQVKFDYKGNAFIIDNRTGTHFVGTVICKLSPDIKAQKFSIDSRSPLANLFSSNKGKFKISCKDKGFQRFLNANRPLDKLGKIAQDTKFHPQIACNTKAAEGKIVTKYHLEFDDWTQVLEPLIAFYKDIIDELERQSDQHKSYR